MLRFAAVATCMLGALVAADSQDFNMVPTSETETVAVDQGVFTVDLGNTRAVEAFKEMGITIEQGKSVRFSVQGNPTTGYEWTWDPTVANGAFTVTTDYVMDIITPDQEGYTGIGGTYYFTVEATANGENQGTLKLYEGRSWENINEAIMTYEFNVTVA